MCKPDGHRFTSFVILHGDDGSVRHAPFVTALEPHTVIELQRQRGKEDGEVSRCKLQDGSLAQLRASSTKSGYLYGDANSDGLRKESCQLLRTAQFALRKCHPT